MARGVTFLRFLHLSSKRWMPNSMPLCRHDIRNINHIFRLSLKVHCESCHPGIVLDVTLVVMFKISAKNFPVTRLSSFLESSEQ